ncbi:hypothetical protein CFE70_002648 [Pyrenophora teres f. teres 0-1]|nr:hypothetical protein HRS9139_02499 [Pyrenophora teres f. teres]CAA9959129.1 hypothetical protein PTMSG1_02653 [Pyrenophora teres f. maculata]KAE8849741.1 hypothetical protein PTNB85_00157 [Pyrenophora teres f. teres]KAE8852232.1 hypothetical protein HRS9122_02519 [Pyrenophora teres f. teres]KAE8870903.1 hypothetical protein PTNB29_01247 [Pyrenophora teres f. teres]
MEESMTFKSVSSHGTSSSKASSLFSLNADSKKSILVYRYRSGAKGLEVKTERDLCAELDQDPNLAFVRVARKPIPRGNSRLDILNEDLLSPSEREMYGEKPTLKASVANVGLPTMARWKHMILGSYEDLYIVSRLHTPSPESSKNNSPESSQHVSPAATFPNEALHAPNA